MAPDDLKLDRLVKLTGEPIVDANEKPKGQVADWDKGETERKTERAESSCRETIEDKKEKSLEDMEDCPNEQLDCQTREIASSDQTMINLATTREFGNQLESAQPLRAGQKTLKTYGACDNEQNKGQGVRSNRLDIRQTGEKPNTLSGYMISHLNWRPSFGGRGQSISSCESQQIRKHGDEDQERASRNSGSDHGKEPASRPEKTRLERLAKCVPGLGIIMSLCASLFLGTAGMLVKLTTSVHGIEVAVLRGIQWFPKRDELYPVGTRAILGGFSITLSYYALKLIPLGDATTIRFSLPIWTLIMSYFFLRESCSSFKIFAVIISISGVVLVTKPDMCVMYYHRLLNKLYLESASELSQHELHYERSRVEELAFLLEAPLSGDDNTDRVYSLVQNSGRASDSKQFETQINRTQWDLTSYNEDQFFNNNETNFLVSSSDAPTLTYSPDAMRQFEGCLMALGSSICLSISIIALRMCKGTPSEVSIFWLSVSSIITGTLTLVAMGEWSVPNNLNDCLYIILNGVCGSLGQWFMTNALKIEQSGVISLARTFDIEVAFLYSAFLLGEEIRPTSIFGSILVSLGVISVVVPRWLGCGVSAPDEQVEESSSQTSVTDATSDHSSNGVDFNVNNGTINRGLTTKNEVAVICNNGKHHRASHHQLNQVGQVVVLDQQADKTNLVDRGQR